MMGESIVLVITPSPYLTDKIQKNLEDLGGYNIITSKSPAVALEFARNSTIDICILDVFHPEFPVLTVVRELRKNHPDIRLILLLSDPSFTHEAIPEIIPDGLLPRSFNLEQLKFTLASFSKGIKKVAPSNQEAGKTLPHAKSEQSFQSTGQIDETSLSKIVDFSYLHQNLSNLSINTDALAIIIVRRKQLLSHRGRLPYSAIQEIVELINSFSKTSAQNLQKETTIGYQKSESGDMIRFVQLQGIPDKLLLYAISLTKEMLLIVVFEADTQFSTIRRQTKQITHELMESQRGVPIEDHPIYPVISEPVLSKSFRPIQNESIFEMRNNPSVPQMYEHQTVPTADSTNEPNLSAVNPPTTGMEEIGSTISPEPSSTEIGDQSSGDKFTQGMLDKKMDFHDRFELDVEGEGEPMDARPTRSDTTGPFTKEYESVSVTPASSYGSYITYSCLLVPRMPQHLMTSNLSAYLFKWTGQLCLAFGWRLEHLSIHPSHIQMIAGAPLNTSPAFLVRTLRQKTSQYIFSQFPPLTSENPSGDFWAPGFFISGGKQTIQPHLIDQYIREIRQNQGISTSTAF